MAGEAKSAGLLDFDQYVLPLLNYHESLDDGE